MGGKSSWKFDFASFSMASTKNPDLGTPKILSEGLLSQDSNIDAMSIRFYL